MNPTLHDLSNTRHDNSLTSFRPFSNAVDDAVGFSEIPPSYLQPRSSKSALRTSSCLAHPSNHAPLSEVELAEVGRPRKNQLLFATERKPRGHDRNSHASQFDFGQLVWAPLLLAPTLFGAPQFLGPTFSRFGASPFRPPTLLGSTLRGPTLRGTHPLWSQNSTSNNWLKSKLAEVEIGRSRNWPKSKLAEVEIG